MNKDLFYAKNKRELEEKILKLITMNNKNVDNKIKNIFTNWYKWFQHYYDKIELPEIKQFNLFYRAFHTVPNYYAIQIWKINSDGIREFMETVYASTYQEDFREKDYDTIIFLNNIDYDNTPLQKR